MSDSTTFKKQYLQADLKEIREWFDAHEAELPDTLQLDKATYYKSLKSTVKTYLEIIHLHGDNPTYSGQIHQLFLIREKLQEMKSEA